jgi:hypothetical protein
MSMSLIAFMTMAAIAILFMTALLVSEVDFRLSSVKQRGDSSLGPQSVNWLGAIAITCAVLICLF